MHMRSALALLVALTLPACSTTQTAATDGPAPAVTASAEALAGWEAWKANENSVWASTPFAHLKIDDAVYLNDGQSAWLRTPPSGDGAHAWTLDRRQAPRGLRVTYAPPLARITYKGNTSSFTLDKPQVVNVSTGVDVRVQLTQVEPGKQGLRVMVFNQANPAAAAFKGLDYFPYNPDAVVQASFVAADEKTGVDFQTSRGWFKRFYRMGVARFTLGGKPVELPMYADTADPQKVKSLSAFFTDELTGTEAYGVGRYIDIDVQGLPASLTIDFNQAYNPNCARSPHFNCPLAQDRLPVALRAGEKMPPKH